MFRPFTQSLTSRRIFTSAITIICLLAVALLVKGWQPGNAAAGFNASAAQATTAATPGWQWAAQAAGGNPEIGYGVAQDHLGNVYVTGNFVLTASFGPINVTSNGGGDAFIAKYNSAGVPQWVRNVGGSEFDSGNDIAVDAVGNVYVAGSFSGTATFGNLQLTSTGSRDGFVVKYDGAGTFQWARKIGGSADDFAQGIGVDPAGNAYLTGKFTGSMTVGSTTLTSNGGADVFVAKFNTAGTAQWAQKGGGGSEDLGWDVAADGAGNAFVSGRFLNSATFGTITLNSVGQDDIFAAKYDTAGTLLWAKQAGSPSSDDGYAVGADGQGGCYVAGRFGGVQGLNGTFGSITLTSSGGSDIFAAKYDAAGNVLWAERGGGAANDEGRGVEADDAGNCYVTGQVAGTATFGSETVTSGGSSDLFVAKYSATGAFQWVQQTGDTGGDEGEAISIDPRTACIAVTGRFNGTVSFGSTTLTANNTDALVARTFCPCARQSLAVFNTGFSADGLAMLAPGQVDPHYVLQNTSPVFPDAIVPQPNQIPWAGINGPNSQWIGPDVNPLGNSPVGFYTYRTTFNLPEGCDLSSAVIAGHWATDNEAEIFLNGTSTGFITGPADFATFTPFVITSGFNSGSNNLDFRVRNRGVGGGSTPTATGLRVELTGSIVCCACVTPPTGLVDWWPFDETSGPTAQDIRGTANNAGTHINGPTPGPGKVGGALCLDGVDDYVEVQNHPEVNVFGDCVNDGADSFTIDAWVKTSESLGLQVILDKRVNPSAPQGYHFYLFNGRLGFQASGANYVAPASGPQYVNVADGRWHFVAVSIVRCRTALRSKLYVDGNVVLTFDPIVADISNTANLQIGRRDPAFGEVYFKGCIDELEFFNHALSEAEVRALYEARSGGKCFRQPCPEITINPATLVHQTWGANVNYPPLNFTAAGGTGPYTFSVSGGVPPGMSVDANGLLQGTPTTPGTYNFSVTATDANGCHGVRQYRINIVSCPALTLTPTVLPAGTVSTPYTPTTFTASGGSGSYTFTASGLPAGLTLSATGILTGTPSQNGSFTVTVTVTDTATGCFKSITITLVIACAERPIRIFNTGVNNGGGLLAAGANEQHYILQASSPNTPAVVLNPSVIPGVWQGPSASSQWIGPAVMNSSGSAPGGFYTYRIIFNLDGCETNTASITGQWATDNEASAVLNGTTVPGMTTPANGFTWQTFTINAGFVQGANTLDLVVRNRPFSGGGGTETGLRVEITRATARCCACTAPPQPASMVAWYPFDADARDLAGSNDLGVFGPPPNNPTVVPGKVAQAFRFDGTDDFVRVANSTEINFPSNCPAGVDGPLTIDAWVRTTASAGVQTILDKRINSNQPVGYALYLVDGRLGFQLADGSGPSSVCGSNPATSACTNYVAPASGPQYVNVADGNWHLIAVTISKCPVADGRMYVDGNLVHTFTPRTGNINNTAALSIGRHAFDNSYFNGDIDELEMFKTALTEAELDAIFNAGSAGKCKPAGDGLMFYPLASPVRLLDTRSGASPNACSQPNAPIPGGTSRTQSARNFCGLPANARAITGNITTVQSGGGYLTLFPSGAAQPTVASTNYAPNEIVNNVFTVGLGNSDGAFNIFALNTTEVVVDVTGYYAPPGPGGLYFHPLPAPVRLLETRRGQPVGCVKPGAPLAGGADALHTATTACTGIPAAARAIVGNATTVSPQGPGYLTLFPAEAARPLIASSNYATHQIVNGPFTTGLSAEGQFKVFTLATTDLVIDVLGYYSAEATDANGAGLLFTPLAHPVRWLETRAGQAVGCFKPGQPLAGNQSYVQTARGSCDGQTIPASALAVVGNATVVSPATGGYLTLWPASAVQPTVATVNYNGGDIVNRHFIVGLGNADGAFKMFSFATTDLVIDLSGYFAPGVVILN